MQTSVCTAGREFTLADSSSGCLFVQAKPKHGSAENQGNDECPKGSFFIRDVPVVPFKNQATDNLPDNEQPEHEAAHQLRAVMQVGGQHFQREGNSKGNTRCIVWKFAFLIRHPHIGRKVGRGSLMVLRAQLVQALLHFGAQVVLNPRIGCLQPIGFEDSADLGFYPGGVAGESQKVIAGKLNKELAVYLASERENPLPHV